MLKGSCTDVGGVQDGDGRQTFLSGNSVQTVF